jgi:hypothetical protein
VPDKLTGDKPLPLSQLRGVIAFTAAYLLLAGAWVVQSGNYEFLAYIAIMLILAWVVRVVHRRVALPRSLIWCLSIWGALHMAGGLMPLPASWDVGGLSPVLYNWHIAGPYFKYDQVVHAFGFGITTWVCWCGVRALAPGVQPTLGALTLCAAAGMGFGALNEVIEFAITLLVPENNVGGYLNTALDLVYNFLGTLIAAGALHLRGKQ